MVIMATSMVKKSYLEQNIFLIWGFHFMVLWKGYHNFDFLQNLEGMHVFGMIHWPIRDGINLRLQRSLLVHQVSRFAYLALRFTHCYDKSPDGKAEINRWFGWCTINKITTEHAAQLNV